MGGLRAGTVVPQVSVFPLGSPGFPMATEVFVFHDQGLLIPFLEKQLGEPRPPPKLKPKPPKLPPPKHLIEAQAEMEEVVVEEEPAEPAKMDHSADQTRTVVVEGSRMAIGVGHQFGSADFNGM